MEQHEIAAVLSSVEIVCNHADQHADRPYTETWSTDSKTCTCVLTIEWPVVTLNVSHATNVGRETMLGAQVLCVNQTTIKWVDGKLTLMVRQTPLPCLRTLLNIQYIYDQDMYMMFGADGFQILYSCDELSRRLLVNIVTPWSFVGLHARVGPPPTAKDLLARIPWDTVFDAVADLQRTAQRCPTLYDIPSSSGWTLQGRHPTWFAKSIRGTSVALQVSGAPQIGVLLLGFHVAGTEVVALSAKPADLVRGVWMLQIGPRWFACDAHPFAENGALHGDLCWVCQPPRPVAGLLDAVAANGDLD